MIQEGLTFNEVGHVYSWHGRPVIGVTSVLQAVGLVDTRWFTEEAALRGTYVHEATALFDRNQLNESTLDPALVPYMEAYKKFLADTRFEPVLIEEALYSEVYKFSGTMDRTGNLNNRYILLDIKTGAVPKWITWQTAAYQHLVSQIGQVHERYSLQLKEDGTYRLSEPITDPMHWHEFLAMLTVYNCKKRIGVLE